MLERVSAVFGWHRSNSRKEAISEPSSVEVTCQFEAPRTDVSITGVIPLIFEFATTEATLSEGFFEVGTAQAAIIFKKELFIRNKDRIFLRLNSHLLPDGPTVLFGRLVLRNGAVAWEQTFSFHVANTGPLAEAVRASMMKFGTPLLAENACDSSDYDFSDVTLRPWFDRPDAADYIEQLVNAGLITVKEAGALKAFVDDGYMVMDDLVEQSLIDDISRELDDVVERKLQGYKDGSSQRIINLHLTYPGVRRLWSHPNILRILSLVFDAPARPCQTLAFICGSQQDAHQDTVHLTPFPAGYMCGVWVAIDDVLPNSGELVVYRGSHRTPRLYVKDFDCAKVSNGDWGEFGKKLVPHWRRMLDEGGYEKIVYQPKKGTVLIWHENLLHAGSVRTNKSLTRRSIVSHVFADGAVAFYDSTGMPGHMEPLEKHYRKPFDNGGKSRSYDAGGS